jgi:hypothetical protein
MTFTRSYLALRPISTRRRRIATPLQLSHMPLVLLPLLVLMGTAGSLGCCDALCCGVLGIGESSCAEPLRFDDRLVGGSEPGFVVRGLPCHCAFEFLLSFVR